MLHAERHTYLKKYLCDEIPQKVLNRTIHRALQWKTTNRQIPQCQPVVSQVMAITTSQNIDVTRIKQGFGRWALPKLKKELHHPDLFIVMRAIVTVLEIVHEPEKTFEALRLGFVERLCDLMLHPKEFIREHVCMIYYVLADQLSGARAIVRRYKILANFARLLEDEVPCVQHKAQMVVEMISRHLAGVFNLNCGDYMLLIVRLIGGTPCTELDEVLLLHLMTLHMLLELNVKILALDHGCMDILMKKLDHEKEDICVMVLTCLTKLCWDPVGRAQADEKAILFRLKPKLFDERLRVHTKAAGAITFMTITSQGRHFALSLDLMDRLLELAGNFHCSELQLMSIKALTNLAEEGAGRSMLLSPDNQKRVESVVPSSLDVERHLGILLDVMRWEP